MRLLNVGGGSKKIPLPVQYDGWDHDLLDISPGPDVDVVLDARLLYLKGDANQYDAVYCAHNLEHYYDHELPLVLAGFRRVLHDGGNVHIIVPNLGQLICDMVDLRIDLEDVLYTCDDGPITPLDVFFGYGKEIRESGEDFYAHKTGFTARRLHKLLEKAGFAEVKVVANLPSLELEATGTI